MKRRLTAAVLMLGMTGCTAAPPPSPAPPPTPIAPVASHVPPTPQPSLSIQLVDGKTRAIMAGVTATLTSADGKHRVDARADAEGGVHVPIDVMGDAVTVAVKGYRSQTVRRDTGRRPKRVVTVRLVPQ